MIVLLLSQQQNLNVYKLNYFDFLFDINFFDERMNVFRATQIDIVEFSNKIIGLNQKQ